MNSADPAPEDYLYLLGRTPQEEYLRWMAKEPVEADRGDPARLAALWEKADAAVRKLEQREPEFADYPPLQSIPAELKPLVAQVRADPFFQRAFSQVPCAFGVVELDRLVVRQKSINLSQVRRLQARLGPRPTPEEVFRFCLPFDHPTIPPRVTALPDGAFDFASPSNDLRFLEAVVVRPEQVRDYQPFGPVAGVVAVVVGYGSNYLNAIAAQGRLVLHNGSHRAYALRDLGLTHAPCVIQETHARDELLAVATGALRRTPELYLEQPRPPVLKDYFNPELCQRVRLPASLRHVRIRFSRDEFDEPGTWDG